MHLLWWIIVGLIAGWATGKIMRGSGYGPFIDIVIGVLGAIVGGWIMRAVGFRGHGGMLYTILVAIGGAILLTWLSRFIIGPRGMKHRIEPTDIDKRRSDSDWRNAA